MFNYYSIHLRLRQQRHNLRHMTVKVTKLKGDNNKYYMYQVCQTYNLLMNLRKPARLKYDVE